MNQYEIDMAIESLMDDMDMYDYAMENTVMINYKSRDSDSDAWRTYGALATGAMVGQAAVALGNHSWNRGIVTGLRKRTTDAIASGDRRTMRETRKYLIEVRENTLRTMTNSSQAMVIRACEENIALIDGALRAH